MTSRGRAARASTALLAALALLVACSGSEESGRPRHVELVAQYFHANNAAAREGPAAQQEFLERTQHPDFSGQACDLGDATVSLDPALSTLRPDRDFAPGGVTPRGRTWVVGVEVTVRRRGAVVATQIGSQHLVLLQGHVYGFAPCPA